MREQWSLVGRADEQRRMQQLLARGAHGLVIAGRAGTGKTRLAREFLQVVEADGAAVIRIAATHAASQLPLGAFAPVLPLAEEARDIPRKARGDLIRAIAARLVEDEPGRRIVVFVDDAHLLDNTSALLLQHLAASGGFVVLAIRTGEAAPGPVVSLWKDDQVERWELGALSAESLEELLSTVLKGPVDRAALHRLIHLSEGNILFFRELTLGAIEDGSLRIDRGLWRLVAPLTPSPRLADLVEARLQLLSAAERDILELLAFGEPLGFSELTTATEAPLIEGLERRGLITSSIDGRRLEARLGFAVYGEVIRSHTPTLRRVAIATQLADVVTATGARRKDDAARIATWRLEGGGGHAGDLLAAAHKARWNNDFPLAERLSTAAVRAGAGFDAELLAAQIAMLQGRGAAVEMDLALLAERAADDRALAMVASTRFDNLAVHLGRLEDGLRVAEEAEAVLTDPKWRDELTGRRATALTGAHGPRVGVELNEPLLGRTEGRVLVWAAINAAYALARMGRLAEARRAATVGHEAHLALKEPLDWHPSIHIFSRANALANEGRLDYSRMLSTDQYQRALNEGSPEAQALFAWQLTKAVSDQGFPATAATYGRESVALFMQLGRPLMAQFAMGSLALALAIAGDASAATEVLAELDALGLPFSRYWAVDNLHARAWTSIALGDLPGGYQHLRDAVQEGEETGDLVGYTTALHTLARIGHASEVVDRLKAMAPQIEGPLALARAEHAMALHRQDPVQLTQVSADFEAMAATLLAAEAAADAAVAWRRKGDPRQGARAEQTAISLARRCEHPVTPSLRTVETRSRLTRAENEIALLASSGRHNKEIAGRLGVSVRTVENHLQHVYSKLGISSREDLADALGTLT